MLRKYIQRAANSHEIRQGFWLIFGLVGTQSIRLIGNLILTRMLVPEAFGLVALSLAVITGFNMLSDVGIRNSVIKSDRADDPAFMETVWTLQFLRGLVLMVCLWLLAWPISLFYQEEVLLPVLLVMGCSLLFEGSKSVALFVYDKRLHLKRQVLVDTAFQLVGVVIMIAFASVIPSVWALVLGHLITGLLSLLASYLWFHGHHSKFRIEKEAARDILSFGKWIFLSSIIGYLALHGDKLIIGFWTSPRELGVYSIAVVFSGLVSMLAAQFSGRMLDALFKQYLDAGRLNMIEKVRWQLNGLYLLGCLALAWLGDWIIRILYDDRYLEAGWMLQLLALRSFALCLNTTITPFLLARGDSFSQMKYQTVSTIALVLGMLAGAQLGIFGLLAAYAVVPAFSHLYLSWLAHGHGLRSVRIDFPFLCVFVLLSASGWFLLNSAILQKIQSLFLM